MQHQGTSNRKKMVQCSQMNMQDMYYEGIIHTYETEYDHLNKWDKIPSNKELYLDYLDDNADDHFMWLKKCGHLFKKENQNLLTLN